MGKFYTIVFLFIDVIGLSATTAKTCVVSYELVP